MLRNIVLIGSVLFLTGCTGSKINIAEYSKVSLSKSSSQVSKSGKKRVVVFESEAKSNLAKKYGISTIATSDIERYVSKTAELVDRNIAGKLKEEILLAETKSSKSWGGENVADYAIMSDITESRVGSKFSDAYTTKDKKGNIYYHSARCKYSATVKGNIKIYTLPSLKLQETLQIADTVSASEDTKYSSCSKVYTNADNLLQKAMSGAVENKQSELKNMFAIAGYIKQRRTKVDGDDIFRITLGKNLGAKEGVIARISRTENVVDEHDGQTEIEIIRLGEGIVTNVVEDEYSWILIKDKKVADKLMWGDTVTLFYENDTFFDKVQKGMNTAVNTVTDAVK